MEASPQSGFYKSYKNVNKTPVYLGLTSTMFFPFLGFTVIVLIINVLAKSLVFGFISCGLISGFYGAVYLLTKKHGEYFKDKLLAYYFDQDFKVIKKRTVLKRYVKK